MQGMARTASIYYLVDAVSAIATGLLSDVWIRKGYTPTLVRKTVMAIGYTIACVAMAGFAASPQIYLPWLMAAGVGCGDRKSTRLNSSHRCISYAVFCLKKKKRK